MNPTTITGCVFPVWDSLGDAVKPVFFQLPDFDRIVIGIWKDPEQLRTVMQETYPGVKYEIKQINDGNEFMQTVHSNDLTVVLNLRREGEKTKWTLLETFDMSKN